MTTTASSTSLVPPEAWALALSMLPGCGQHRLRTVLAAYDHDPEAAWRAVASGSPAVPAPPAVVANWRTAAADVDAAAAWNALGDGVGVWVLGGDGYPPALADDPDPPPILFWRGDPEALERPAVGIVGTRRCTAYGTDVARSLGRDLAAAGVTVVSGLALGIDGAAHEGALAAGYVHGRPVDADDDDAKPSHDVGPPIAVVGSALDVVYPTRHRALWQRVSERGLLLTEAPPGALPEPWRFPRRNRILAGLSKVVVVVESHASGGSLSTVRHAIERGISVMAVPGSVRSPSSAGTNRLLADGVAPVTDAEDILVALSLEGATVATPTRPTPTTPKVPDDDSPVLAAVEWTPTRTEDVLRRTGLPLGAVAKELARLEVEGRVRRRGAWWERR
ncbi:MAG TPA: DNA-processing protein DprA [Acidimicrobiales bacterium]|nr:DNA-processing protein DprA [Acidimicrobiales bacterium]